MQLTMAYVFQGMRKHALFIGPWEISAQKLIVMTVNEVLGSCFALSFAFIP